ncbi:MAG: vgr related protein [Pseudomonadota bacterium]
MTSHSEARPLTQAERALAKGVFGDAIDYDRVEIRRRKWAFFQPRHVVMAPMGHMHFHPMGDIYCDDFCETPVERQGLFIHEMVHVWQVQRRGRWFLVLMRWPFDRYSYTLKPGWPLERYGLEQQAEIVRHYFLLAKGHTVPGAPGIKAYRAILPFHGAE